MQKTFKKSILCLLERISSVKGISMPGMYARGSKRELPYQS